MAEVPKIPEMKIGDVVTWTDEDGRKTDATVTKVKQDNQLNLEFPNLDGIKDQVTGELVIVKVTSASHKSIQHPDYGCHWEEK